jgi:hypothetical protein
MEVVLIMTKLYVRLQNNVLLDELFDLKTKVMMGHELHMIFTLLFSCSIR